MSNTEQYTTDIKIENGVVDYSFTGTANGLTTTVTSSGPLVEADANTQQMVEQSRAYFNTTAANVAVDVETAVATAVETTE